MSKLGERRQAEVRTGRLNRCILIHGADHTTFVRIERAEATTTAAKLYL